MSSESKSAVPQTRLIYGMSEIPDDLPVAVTATFEAAGAAFDLSESGGLRCLELLKIKDRLHRIHLLSAGVAQALYRNPL